MPFVKTHQPCNDCGSSDALSYNDDGSSFCFNCEAYTATQTTTPNHTEVQVQAKPLDTEALSSFDSTQYRTILDRGISSETAKTYKCLFDGKDYKFGYTDVQGKVVATKTRTPDKDFYINGDWKSAQLLSTGRFAQ